MNQGETEPWKQPRVTNGPLPLPYHFGRYRFDDCLGRGGMGTVYKAFDTRLERTVALKVPKQGVAAAPEVRQIFLRESQIGARLATLQTLSICHVYDADTHDECPFFTMEYLPGLTLDEYWAAEGPRLGAVGAADIVQKIARVMQRVHELTLNDRTIVHRDLKPNNIFVVPLRGEPAPRLVLLDFGIALEVPSDDPVRAATSEVTGTYGYMPPEQMEPGWKGTSVTARSDVYSLGAILYRLLTGGLPFPTVSLARLKEAMFASEIRPPGDINPLYRPFDDVCRRTLARHPDQRYSMQEFAETLGALYLETQIAHVFVPVVEVKDRPERSLVPRDAIRFAFVPLGFTVPPTLVGQDRLFLDVGNRLQAGVLDHHQGRGSDGPTARLVRDRAELIDAAVGPNRSANAPFTIILHQHPDLDAVASAALAIGYLATRTFPGRADELIAYVDRADSGASCVSLDRPFTLYSAFQRIVARNITAGDTAEKRWRDTVADGLALVEYALAETERTGTPLEELDPFAAPLFQPSDREAVLTDADRYRAKLADPATRARRCRLVLKPREGKGTAEIGAEALVVRNVQNSSDPARCAYFKDWGRTDTKHTRDGGGFAALSVFMPEEAGHPRRCILSVSPGCGGSLEGLGKLLDEAESARRREVFGVDDRKADPVTSEPREPRPGYDNSDPWYDGRSHDFTIVDAPRSGTLLTADEIEAIFLAFGRATEVENLA